MFVVSLISRLGAVSVTRPTPREALAVARRLEAEGEVAITTPAGNTLAVPEFVAIFELA